MPLLLLSFRCLMYYSYYFPNFPPVAYFWIMLTMVLVLVLLCLGAFCLLPLYHHSHDVF
jgi:hypothetical protein